MFIHPILDKLRQLRLTGMLSAFEEQLNCSDLQSLTFEKRLGLMVDRELTERHNRRLQTRLKQAGFQQPAVWEDIDFKTPRGLDKSLLLHLAGGQWPVD